MPEKEQLSVIEGAIAELRKASVPCWLAGGWALDFLLGEVTRPHYDIDIVIWSHDRLRASAALVAAGFEPRPSPRPDELIRLEREAVPLTLSFIERQPHGTLITPGRWSDWPWPADSLDAAPGRIGTSKHRSSASVLDEAGYADHPLGAPRRPKDEADLARLRALVEP